MSSTLRAIVLAVALVAAAAGAPAPPAPPATAAATSLPGDSLYHLDASLTDQDGRGFRLDSLRGEPVLVTMFYTSCKYVCPLIVDSARGVDHALGPDRRAGLRVLLVSMDPARDTPAALRAVVDQRRLDVPRWLLARTSPDDVRRLAAALGVRYRALADGEFNHTSLLVLLDRDGRPVATAPANGAVADPAFMVAVEAALAAPEATTGER